MQLKEGSYGANDNINTVRLVIEGHSNEHERVMVYSVTDLLLKRYERNGAKDIKCNVEYISKYSIYNIDIEFNKDVKSLSKACADTIDYISSLIDACDSIGI